MFGKWGVDEDEFCFAMIHYNLMEDPELVEMTQNRMNNIEGHRKGASPSKKLEEEKGAGADEEDWGEEEGEA
jgi:hypothetical protein